MESLCSFEYDVRLLFLTRARDLMKMDHGVSCCVPSQVKKKKVGYFLGGRYLVLVPWSDCADTWVSLLFTCLPVYGLDREIGRYLGRQGGS